MNPDTKQPASPPLPENIMSDTPLTDNAERKWHEQHSEYAVRDLCRSFEREINSLVRTFNHRHENNGHDDACKKCGLDLRNPVHL